LYRNGGGKERPGLDHPGNFPYNGGEDHPMITEYEQNALRHFSQFVRQLLRATRRGQAMWTKINEYRWNGSWGGWTFEIEKDLDWLSDFNLSVLNSENLRFRYHYDGFSRSDELSVSGPNLVNINRVEGLPSIFWHRIRMERLLRTVRKMARNQPDPLTVSQTEALNLMQAAVAAVPVTQPSQVDPGETIIQLPAISGLKAKILGSKREPREKVEEPGPLEW
jgi:hypothetical protein